MNKTVTVNIGGMVFHIEEQAYEKLKKYLDAIRGYFTTSDGRDEIIQDIESRIAEMFTERIGTSRQVVVESDVEFMIDTLGRPEQVAGEESKENASNSSSFGNATYNEYGTKKLYRDPDDKVISGVCSGISHYFGLDPIWLRLIFAGCLFFWGTGFLFYLVLLIIIPKAKTTAEKLEMKGRPVNIDNIRRTLEDEVEDIKSKINGNSSQKAFKKGTTGVARFFEMLGQLIYGAIKVIGTIFGVILVIVFTSLLFALFVGLLTITGIIGDSQIPVFLSELFLTKTQMIVGIIAAISLIGIPLILIVYKLIRAIFNLKTESRRLNYVAGSIFVLGLILTIWLSVQISNDFKVRDRQTTTIQLSQPAGGTMYIEALKGNDALFEEDNDILLLTDAFSINAKGDSLRISQVSVNVIKSDTDQFELVKIVSGRGSSRKNAESNIRNIKNDVIQTDSLLQIDENYRLDKGIKFRNQKIQYILKVPVGKKVHFNSNAYDIIYDIKNVTNTFDGDMINRTWTMTENGLECVGCILEDNSVSTYDNYEDEDGNVKVRINGKEINVNNTSDEDTINWDNKDVKIRINQEGVVIDAKEKK